MGLAASQVEDKRESVMMRKRILWVILVITATVFVWNHWERSKEGSAAGRTAPGRTSGGGRDLGQKILSFSIDGRSPKGVRQWHLEGNSAEIIEDEIHLNDLEAVAYGDDATVNLTSDRGVYNKEKGWVELMGNVEVVSDKGFTLTTDQARWSQVTKEISTDTVVHIEHKGMTAVGTGGMANSEEKKAMLRKDVTVKMEPQTEVNCAGSMEVDYNGNIAVFYDNVKVTDKDGSMTADKLTVEFDSETQKLARVTAEGNVRVKRGKSYTISDMAIYTESTKSAQLLGNPRVIIDPVDLDELDEFTGTETTQEGE